MVSPDPVLLAGKGLVVVEHSGATVTGVLRLIPGGAHASVLVTEQVDRQTSVHLRG